MINIDKDTPLALWRLKNNLYIYTGSKKDFEAWKLNGYKGRNFTLLANKVPYKGPIPVVCLDDLTVEDITHEEAVLYILKYDMEVV
jgi:hypothetical protein